MLANTVKYMVPVTVSAISFHMSSKKIHNEPNRRFYEDEEPEAETPTGQRLVNGVSISSPSTVESGFRTVRESVYGVYSSIAQYADKGYNKYHSTEERVTSTVSQLHDKTEDLMPNSIYIFIAALSGTIMARQRSVVAKATFPIILGIGSFKYFLPNTFASTANFIWKLEQQKIPEIAKQQETLVNKSGELVNQIERVTETSQKSVDSSLETLKKSIKKYTGLNVDDDVTKK